MGEQLHGPEPGPFDREPELEYLTDWVVGYEVARGESKPELPVVQERPLPDQKELPESFFDRRHEVMDDATVTRPPNLQPMIPLATVLESRTLPQRHTPEARSASTPKKATTIAPRAFKSPQTVHKQAMSRGFLTGLAILAAMLVNALLR